MAAIPLSPVVEVGLAVLASLYGSATASYDSTTATPPAPVPYAQFQDKILDQFNSFGATLALQLQQILTDRVLLPLLGNLFSGTTDNTLLTNTLADQTSLTTAAQTPTRLQNSVRSWAGANGFASMMLFGTPLEVQSAAAAPLI
jgi:hypothetical protein